MGKSSTVFTALIEGSEGRRAISRGFDRGTAQVYFWAGSGGVIVRGEVEEDRPVITVERQHEGGCDILARVTPEASLEPEGLTVTLASYNVMGGCVAAIYADRDRTKFEVFSAKDGGWGETTSVETTDAADAWARYEAFVKAALAEGLPPR